MLARHALASERSLVATEEADRAVNRLENVKAAVVVAQETAREIQERAHQRIASVVTRCLKTIFGDDAYDFMIRFESKRGQTEAQLMLVRDGVEIEPMEAAGGGVVDVAAFALRLACLVLSRPPVRRLLLLDEPFKFVSMGYREQIRGLLLGLAEEMGVQIIMVTHLDDLRIGQVVEIE